MIYHGILFDPGRKHGHNELLNIIIVDRQYTSYLEVGTNNDDCFGVIKCDTKVGVDPNQGGTHRMTSDVYFATHTDTFDLIFIDGYHHHEQVYRDIENSLKVLNPGGLIVMHDCHPPSLVHEGQGACGTAWRAFCHYRQFPQYDMVVGDFDMGVGLMRLRNDDGGKTITLPRPFGELTYQDMLDNEKEWLQLKSPNDVMSWLGVKP